MENALFIENEINSIHRSKPTSKALSIVGSSRSNGDREVDDFYPTPAYAVEKLLEKEIFSGNIWECACRQGDISKAFVEKGFSVHSTDLTDRGFGIGEKDFLKYRGEMYDNIITNPLKICFGICFTSRKYARCKVAMFRKTVFLESEARFEMFNDKEFPLKTMYEFSRRVTLNRDGVKMKNSGMIAYAWFVWDRNHRGKATIE